MESSAEAEAPGQGSVGFGQSGLLEKRVEEGILTNLTELFSILSRIFRKYKLRVQTMVILPFVKRVFL